MQYLKYFCLCSLITPVLLAFGQQDFTNVKIEAQKLSDNIYMLTGSGGNMAVCAGDDGVILIDDQYAPLSDKIKAAIKEISDQPVRFLLNTHWHGDHTGGNENFGKAGANIVAHKNVRERMSTEQHMRAFSMTVPPSPPAALPVMTFDEEIALHLNGDDILAFHVHNAHTDGDAIIYFMQSNIIHMGDTYFKGRYPFIDLGSGGTIAGMINAANKVLMLADSKTQIIPGHGAMSTKAELAEYRDVLMIARDRVHDAIANGKSIEEIKAANLLSEYDASWGGGFINPETFINIVYTDLSRE